MFTAAEAMVVGPAPRLASVILSVGRNDPEPPLRANRPQCVAGRADLVDLVRAMVSCGGFPRCRPGLPVSVAGSAAVYCPGAGCGRHPGIAVAAAPNARCHGAVLLAGALRRPDRPVAAQPHLYSVIDDLSGFGLGQSALAVGGPGQRFGDHDQQQLADIQADVGDVQRAAFCLLASLLAALDVHPRVAMRFLRHSKIAVTMEIYTEAPISAYLVAVPPKTPAHLQAALGAGLVAYRPVLARSSILRAGRQAGDTAAI